MKFEMKVELADSHKLETVIKGIYFDDDRNGKLSNREKLSIKLDKEDPINIIFRGLHNTIVRIYNNDLIDGTLRCIVNESESIELIPCATYCIVEVDKYSFY